MLYPEAEGSNSCKRHKSNHVFVPFCSSVLFSDTDCTCRKCLSKNIQKVCVQLDTLWRREKSHGQILEWTLPQFPSLLFPWEMVHTDGLGSLAARLPWMDPGYLKAASRFPAGRGLEAGLCRLSSLRWVLLSPDAASDCSRVFPGAPHPSASLGGAMLPNSSLFLNCTT